MPEVSTGREERSKRRREETKEIKIREKDRDEVNVYEERRRR